MNTIKIVEWMAVHPYKTPGSADYAYLKIANKVYDCWASSSMESEYDQDIRVKISIIVTAYFEDVVSSIGLWRTFIRKHKELYGKYLPFYDINEDNYYEDEINLEDVIFLIWAAFQKDSYDDFINPEIPEIEDLARKMYRVLDQEFEQVPINEVFLNFIQDKEHYIDFFEFKEMANWLYYESYLMGFENSALAKELIKEMDNGTVPLEELEYTIKSESMFRETTGPLALSTQEWYTSMLKDMGMEKEIAIINAIEFHIADCHLVNGIDEKYFYVTDTQNKEYAVLCSSYTQVPEKAFRSKILITSLVKYDGEWYINGLSIWANEEKVYWETVEATKKKHTMSKDVYEKLLERNVGSPLVYFKDLSEISKWLNKLLNMEGEIKRNVLRDQKNYVVFAYSETDVEVLPGIGCYIKDPQNPLYDPQKAEVEGVVLLVDSTMCPPSMYHYLRENNMLPDARINSHLGIERGRELVRANVDFIARFFRWNKY
jgi:hypothetical protein